MMGTHSLAAGGTALQGYRLSPQQRRLYRLLEADPTSCRAQLVLRIEGPLDRARLQAALARLVARFEILRTEYHRPPGMRQPVQVVTDGGVPRLEEHHLMNEAGRERACRLSELMEEHARSVRGFGAPTLRVLLLSESPGDHRLVLSLSPLSSDARGLLLLAEELARSYAGGGEETPSLQYVDLAQWLDDLLVDEDARLGREHWQAWRERLPRFSPEGQGRSEPRRLEVPFDARTAGFLRQRGGNAAVEAALLAGWGALKLRLGEPGACGLVLDGRRHDRIARAPGLLARALPVEVRPSPTWTFEDLAAQAYEVREEAARWQDYLDPEAIPAGPASPAQIEVRHHPGPLHAAGTTWTVLPLRISGDRSAVKLCCELAGGELWAWVEYEASREAEVEALRLARRLAGVMASACSAPGMLLADLELLGESERHGLLHEWNDTAAVPEPPAGGVHQLVEERAGRAPDAIALTGDGFCLSAGELETLANRLANHLLRQGMAPETPVALALDRSAELVVAALAILKAGGVLVPLDPEYPEEWRARVLADSSSRFLITSSGARQEDGRRVIVVGAGLEPWREESAALPRVEVAPTQAAYVLYTSGSSGAPKGVAVPHQALVSRLLWLGRTEPLAPRGRALLKTPSGFDVALREIFWPLAEGVRLVVAPPGAHRDPAALAGLLARHEITLLNCVPALLAELLGEPGLDDCLALDRVLCGGEEMPPGLPERLYSRLGARARLYNQYGPTEATITALRRGCPPGESPGRVSLGRPIDEVRTQVLDTRLRWVAAGAAGELCLGGVGLARGYWGRADRTAERFVPDPFSGLPGGRLYRTGDRVRHRLDGELEFLGRLDRQVKIRGMRVEPEEIEAVLRLHPEVRETAVVAWGEGGSRHLAGYIVAQPGNELAAPELDRYLRARLPEAMRPTHWVFLPALPRTTAGKLDRRALPPAAAGHPPTAPATELEAWLATLWSGVLERAEIGREDDFFTLGGHSLRGARLIAAVREALGVDLPLRAIFETPTLSGLAARIEDLLCGGTRLPEPIGRVADRDAIPLSFAQERLWFLYRLDPASPVYNVPAAACLRGDLDRRALAGAFEVLVERHEALRTFVDDRPGGPFHGILPARRALLPCVDLSRLAAPERRREAYRLAGAEARRPFALDWSPPLRRLLIRLDTADHLLVATLHHIATDGWSRGIFVRELAAAYTALRRGELPSLSRLPVQYADFAHWQRRGEGEPLAAGLAYWKRKLGGETPWFGLPTDRSRPAVRRQRGCQHAVSLPGNLCRELFAQGRARRSTPFMLLLAAFQTLLLRYTGQVRIRTGSPVSGRDRTEVEPLIGLFVNTLVIENDLGGNPTFGKLLERVGETVLEGWAHRSVPFEKLVEELEPQRSLATTPLFQVAFVLQNAPQEPLRLPGIEVSPLDLDTETSKFDLTLTLCEEEGRLAGSFEYDTDLFDAGTIARLAGHLESLLGGVAADASTRLSDLPLLTATEWGQLLPPPSAPPPVDAPLHALFSARAATQPDAVAVVLDGEVLTYGELDRRAERLAGVLVSQGVRFETPVGVLFPASPALIVAMLGVLKAGGVYVPLDPASPGERLAELLGEVEAPVLVTDDRPDPALPVTGAVVIRLRPEGIERETVAAPAPRVPPECLAYVIFTSGSTGRPKGVAVTHASAVRLFTALRPWFEPSAADRWTLFHSQAFDFSVWEIWGALLFGGRLVIVPEPVRRSPGEWRALLARNEVTVVSQTPSAFYQLVSVDREAESDPLSLELVVLGGEALEPRKVKPWLERHGDRSPRVANLYGITETTVHVTWRAIRMEDTVLSVSPIGSPISDLAVYLLDRRHQPVPLGVPGEIAVAGAGLARGYVGRPGRTAERFVPDPFSGEPGARLYRSGDLARRTPAGELEYLGRVDHQVKIRGHRIEPGEVEAALDGAPDVARSLVVARRARSEQMSLVAYVVPSPGRRPGVEALRRHLRQRLPEPMVPAAFVFLEELPLSAVGKVDRAALPDPGEGRPDLEDLYVEPSGGIEEVLAGIWSQALGIAEIGALDNFFALGGDSILSLRVQSLARERGLDFTLQDLFRHQTVRELAREVERSAGGSSRERRLDAFELLKAADRAQLPPGLEDAYPLTAVQSGMLYHMSFEPDEIVYHNVYSYDLRLRFIPGAFVRSVERVVARHPILRTSFDLSRYSEPLQLVHARAPSPVSTLDLGALDESAQDAALHGVLEHEKRQRFHLTRPPLVRLILCRRNDDQVNLVLTEFHPIFDGWSLHSFLREVFDGYLALLGGRPLPDEAAPALAVRDFVDLETRALHSLECRAFWEGWLRDCAILDLPRWGGAASATEGRIRCLRYPFPEELFVGVKRLARSAAVPVKSVLLAAHLKVLRFLGGPDVTTGLVVSGRPEGADADRILGLFFNVVPFRLVVPDGTWADLVRAVFAREREMLPFRRYPLAQMQSRHGRPLFDVLFNYIHFHGLAGTLSEIELEADFGKWEETHLPLSVACEQDPLSRRLRLSLRYDARQFAAAQIESLLGLYRSVLHEMVDHPAEEHGCLLLLGEWARHQVLHEWSRTPACRAEGGRIDDLFAAQAQRRPDAAALVCGEEQLTFGELRRLAHHVAVGLHRAGVGPEARIGIHLRRSVEFVATLLGVLEAGGAYVPLDPTHPAERLSFLVADTGAPWVVTRSCGVLSLPEGVEELPFHGLVSANGWFDLPIGAGGGEAAYVLHTSGSTGRPKGVVVEHRHVLSYLAGIVELLSPVEGSRLALLSSFAADLGHTVLFPALCCGGCLHLVPEERTTDPEWLADHFSRYAIDVLKIVPSHLAALLTTPRPERLLPREVLVLGGESSDVSLARRVASLAPGCRILNHYGPTEATVGAAAFRVDPAALPASGSIPIGRPLPGSRLYLLGPDFELVPAGVRGEVYIGGSGVARGYWNQAGLTAVRFVPDPFSDVPGARLYRTGDLGRWSPKGELEFLGRADHQVKVRGFRIELGEIESALLRHGAVREAAAAVLRDGAGEPRIAAYVVAVSGLTLDAAELRGYLRRWLPEPMLPTVFVPLAVLPRTANGKVDRAALPAPGDGALARSRPLVPPRTGLEAKLATLWQEVLQVEEIGVDDNFFELGGHSLFLLRMHARIREAVAPSLTLATLFEHSTIASLAGHLAASQKPARQPEMLPGERAEARRRSLRSRAELRRGAAV